MKWYLEDLPRADRGPHRLRSQRFEGSSPGVESYLFRIIERPPTSCGGGATCIDPTRGRQATVSSWCQTSEFCRGPEPHFDNEAPLLGLLGIRERVSYFGDASTASHPRRRNASIHVRLPLLSSRQPEGSTSSISPLMRRNWSDYSGAVDDIAVVAGGRTSDRTRPTRRPNRTDDRPHRHRPSHYVRGHSYC